MASKCGLSVGDNVGLNVGDKVGPAAITHTHTHTHRNAGVRELSRCLIGDGVAKKCRLSVGDSVGLNVGESVGLNVGDNVGPAATTHKSAGVCPCVWLTYRDV